MRVARAEVPGIRQETQFTCMATSLTAALRAQGKSVVEEDVNRVMGAGALRGASWEELLATAQYFGMRASLVIPATVSMLRAWVDQGIPVIIAWNPEGRPWSHASVVFDVDDDGNVHIMDPNIPDPDETVRIVSKAELYKTWGEPLGDKMIVRRPACAIEREVTSDGRQVMASMRTKTGHGDVRDWGRLEPDADQLSLGLLEELARLEGAEATNPKDALHMLAWDTGYQGERMAPWFKKLGKQLRVDVNKAYRDGVKAGKENKYASKRTKTASVADHWINQSTAEQQIEMATGRQVMADDKSAKRLADQYLDAGRRKRKPTPVHQKKDEGNTIRVRPSRGRDDASRDLAEGRVNIRKGPHGNKPMRGKGQKGQGKPQRHQKHKQDLRRSLSGSVARVADLYTSLGSSSMNDQD